MNCFYCNKPIQQLDYGYQKQYCSYKCVSARFKKDRSALVTRLNSGQYSLTELAPQYGISRERVRQIFRHETGKKFFKDVRQPYLKEQRAIAREKKERSIKFICKGCQEPINYKDGYQKQKFCELCRILRIDFQLDVTTKCVCEMCKRSFSPYRNYKYTKAKNRFCCQGCYMKSSTFQNLPLKYRVNS